jgi:NAD(P)-dependent dehydrogenase (short-subunit alcohol dehydrogenase family)
MEHKAIVTGGMRGIGAEVVLALSRRGYAVTVVGQDPGHGERAVARIGDDRFIRTDLSVLAEVRVLGERPAAGYVQFVVGSSGDWPMIAGHLTTDLVYALDSLAEGRHRLIIREV